MFPQWRGDLFISALVPGDVRRLVLSDTEVESEEILFDEFDRLRAVAEAPDGSLVLSTDGRNGQLIRVSAPQVVE
jgi:glucose/arabinose dehydrogenase